MTFNPPKPAGWSFGEVLTSTQMNQLNTDFPLALDGRSGGTYAPTAPITINGTGAVVGGSGLLVNGPLYTAGSANINGPATFNGTTTVAGSSGLSVTSAGGFTCSGRITGLYAVKKASGAAGTEFFAYTNRHIYADSGTVSAGCIWQIVANPPIGDAASMVIMRFVNFSNVSITVKDPAGATLTSMVYTSGNPYAQTFAWNGANWLGIDVSWRP